MAWNSKILFWSLGVETSDLGTPIYAESESVSRDLDDSDFWIGFWLQILESEFPEKIY